MILQTTETSIVYAVHTERSTTPESACVSLAWSARLYVSHQPTTSKRPGSDSTPALRISANKPDTVDNVILVWTFFMKIFTLFTNNG